VWHAIQKRQHIRFNYNGQPRDACPVILGYSDNGREAVKVYQVGGGTSSSNGKLPAWRDIYRRNFRIAIEAQVLGARVTATSVLSHLSNSSMSMRTFPIR
jgi:hypothetical protein